MQKLKRSPYNGAEMIDKLATSDSHDFDSETSRPSKYHGTVQNHWTDLVLKTQV